MNVPAGFRALLDGRLPPDDALLSGREMVDRVLRPVAELPLFAAVAQPAAPAYRAGPSPLEAALADLDVDGMSPREAMEALYRLKGLAS